MKEPMKIGLTVSLMDEFTPLPDQRNIKIIVWQVSLSGRLLAPTGAVIVMMC